MTYTTSEQIILCIFHIVQLDLLLLLYTFFKERMSYFLPYLAYSFLTKSGEFIQMEQLGYY